MSECEWCSGEGVLGQHEDYCRLGLGPTEVRDILARHGLTGADGETAFRAWRRNSNATDGARVQRIIEVERLPI